MPSWRFITNHAAVLTLVARHLQITAREIATQLGITERSVLRIISDLETAGYLRRVRKGRVNRYQVNRDLPLRRPEIQDIEIGQLLQVLLPGDIKEEAPPSATNG